MIYDAFTLTAPARLHAGLCVVGSGSGGTVAATVSVERVPMSSEGSASDRSRGAQVTSAAPLHRPEHDSGASSSVSSRQY